MSNEPKRRPHRPSRDFTDIGHETEQFGIVAGLTLLAFIGGQEDVKFVAGMVDLFMAMFCVAAVLIASHYGGAPPLTVTAVYASVTAAFAILAVLNLAA